MPFLESTMRCPRRFLSLLIPGILTLVVQSVIAKDVSTLEINSPAPELDLLGVDGKTYQLNDFADSKLLVLIFTCNHCPTAQAYEQRIIQLHADYRDKGVSLVAISPNDPLAVRLDELGYTDVGDSLEDMKRHAKRRDFKFPYLYDGETQRVSTALGALATPHVFIFDEQRQLRYNGRIDDADIKPPKSHDTRNAIDDLLAGRPVAVPKTRVISNRLALSNHPFRHRCQDASHWLDVFVYLRATRQISANRKAASAARMRANTPARFRYSSVKSIFGTALTNPSYAAFTGPNTSDV
jgi:peroxiredoxin